MCGVEDLDDNWSKGQCCQQSWEREKDSDLRLLINHPDSEHTVMNRASQPWIEIGIHRGQNEAGEHARKGPSRLVIASRAHPIFPSDNEPRRHVQSGGE